MNQQWTKENQIGKLSFPILIYECKKMYTSQEFISLSETLS